MPGAGSDGQPGTLGACTSNRASLAAGTQAAEFPDVQRPAAYTLSALPDRTLT
jgi:hypothetical protein